MNGLRRPLVIISVSAGTFVVLALLLAIPLPAYLLGWPGYLVRVRVDDELRYFSVRPDGSSERGIWSWWFAW